MARVAVLAVLASAFALLARAQTPAIYSVTPLTWNCTSDVFELLLTVAQPADWATTDAAQVAITASDAYGEYPCTILNSPNLTEAAEITCAIETVDFGGLKNSQAPGVAVAVAGGPPFISSFAKQAPYTECRHPRFTSFKLLELSCDHQARYQFEGENLHGVGDWTLQVRNSGLNTLFGHCVPTTEEFDNGGVCDLIFDCNSCGILDPTFRSAAQPLGDWNDQVAHANFVDYGSDGVSFVVAVDFAEAVGLGPDVVQPLPCPAPTPLPSPPEWAGSGVCVDPIQVVTANVTRGANTATDANPSRLAIDDANLRYWAGMYDSGFTGESLKLTYQSTADDDTYLQFSQPVNLNNMRFTVRTGGDAPVATTTAAPGPAPAPAPGPLPVVPMFRILPTGVDGYGFPALEAASVQLPPGITDAVELRFPTDGWRYVHALKIRANSPLLEGTAIYIDKLEYIRGDDVCLTDTCLQEPRNGEAAPWGFCESFDETPIDTQLFSGKPRGTRAPLAGSTSYAILGGGDADPNTLAGCETKFDPPVPWVSRLGFWFRLESLTPPPGFDASSGPTRFMSVSLSWPTWDSWADRHRPVLVDFLDAEVPLVDMSALEVEFYVRDGDVRQFYVSIHNGRIIDFPMPDAGSDEWLWFQLDISTSTIWQQGIPEAALQLFAEGAPGALYSTPPTTAWSDNTIMPHVSNLHMDVASWATVAVDTVSLGGAPFVQSSAAPGQCVAGQTPVACDGLGTYPVLDQSVAPHVELHGDRSTIQFAPKNPQSLSPTREIFCAENGPFGDAALILPEEFYTPDWGLGTFELDQFFSPAEFDVPEVNADSAVLSANLDKTTSGDWYYPIVWRVNGELYWIASDDEYLETSHPVVIGGVDIDHMLAWATFGAGGHPPMDGPILQEEETGAEDTKNQGPRGRKQKRRRHRRSSEQRPAALLDVVEEDTPDLLVLDGADARVSLCHDSAQPISIGIKDGKIVFDAPEVVLLGHAIVDGMKTICSRPFAAYPVIQAQKPIAPTL